jgi:hypothetical protein
MIVNGFTHFYEFYGKLNVVCDLHSKTKDMNVAPMVLLVGNIFGTGANHDTAEVDKIIAKKHAPKDLIETFDNKQSSASVTTTFSTKFKINNTTKPLSIMISTDVKHDDKVVSVDFKTQNSWFNESGLDLFKVDSNNTSNIIALSSVTEDNNHTIIKTLFESDDPTNKYIWQTKNDMLVLFNRPVLLIAFDMYYYNKASNHLFTKSFDVVKDDTTAAKDPLTVNSLLYMEKFDLKKPPSFLMLLIYYAGYSFNIKSDDITNKFRNKFYNKKSFEIKLYAPIDSYSEITYNNLLKSKIKPTSVDLDVETLEVYHVGSKIDSFWDYVNGKLTILISNMLSNGTEKDRIKELFKKEYSSNSLFLFECIRELKKYKEYILNPQNITTIAYPMSTLKTIEILILKLSYILSVLEPTFIPLETMSFDVVMDGKKLKYVINSELQATNISVEDHISNERLMTAILATRDIVLNSSNVAAHKDKSLALISDDYANSIYKMKFDKEYSDYENKIARESVEQAKLTALGTSLAGLLEKYKGLSEAQKEKNEKYINDTLKVLKNKLAVEQSKLRLTYFEDKLDKVKSIIKAITDKTDINTPVRAYDAIKEESDNNAIKAINTEIATHMTKLTSKGTAAVVGGSSKNTTKKVYRKQRQAQTKKVFESDPNN